MQKDKPLAETDTANDPGLAGKGKLNLARDILHDLNQPLTAINNYAQAGSFLLENGAPDEARLKELFEKISAQSGRSFEISKKLRKELS